MKHLSTMAIVLFFCLVLVTEGLAGTRAEIFSDDFEDNGGIPYNIEDNWTVGTNTAINPGGADLDVVDGEVAFSQGYDYIETNVNFGDSFEISMQVRRTSGSVAKGDFIVEIVEIPDYSGFVRFQYGGQDYYMINIGTAPTTDIGGAAGNGDDITLCDPDFSQTLDRNGYDQMGIITYTYANGAMKFAFIQPQMGSTIETPWVNTGGTFSATKIRIWGMGSGLSGDGTRRLDDVTIDAPIIMTGGLLIDGTGAIRSGDGDGSPLSVLGNISCTGSMTEGSSRSLKRGITTITSAKAISACYVTIPMS